MCDKGLKNLFHLVTGLCLGMTRVGHAHMVLRGHRSIVNQVRYNKSSALMISSGVEKVIKVGHSLLAVVILYRSTWPHLGCVVGLQEGIFTIITL